jgi:hypothetical protein
MRPDAAQPDQPIPGAGRKVARTRITGKSSYSATCGFLHIEKQGRGKVVKKELRTAVYVTVLGLLVGLALICWWVALTVPMVASDGPIVLSIFLTVVAFLVWRYRRRVL